MPARGISTCRDAPCGHLPPGIFPLARIFPRASSPLRASSPGHLPTPSYPLAPAPLAGIFPRASSHAIIPSCTCPPCGHLPPGIFPRHHTLLFLCNVYDDTMVAGGAVRQWRRNIRVLHVALQIHPPHNNRVTASLTLPRQFPQYPHKIPHSPLQGRAAPRLTAI